MNLTAENVNKTFLDCLFEENEDKTKRIPVEGIQMKVGFNPIKLEKNKSFIIEMLNDLPDNFKVGKGGGWSFLKMCDDKYGNQWTGFHRTMEELVCLGIAIEKISFLMPRDVWTVLPGGMPYIAINE